MFSLLRNIPDDDYLCFHRTVSNWGVTEDGDGLKLEIDVPGCSKEDIDVEVNRSTIFIEVKLEGRESKSSYKIPSDVDYSEITAEVVHGVLKVSLPKGKKRKIL